ncbi:MAG: sigma-70 family RNA polymerase sigma factor [Jatrophihabitantaceae bacterium]
MTAALKAARPTTVRNDPDPLTRLAVAAAGGNTAATATLVAETSRVVWRTCAGLVDRASADDLTQDTYLRAIQSLPSYRGESNPIRWLLTIARRVCAEEIAHRQRHRAVLARLAAERRAVSVDSGSLIEIADGLARLPTERREAFVLTVVAGLSYADASIACGCPIGTIRSRVARARADLVTWLSDADEQAPVALWDQNVVWIAPRPYLKEGA